MPYLKLETNVAISDAKAGALLKELAAAVSRVTGKPESVVQAGIVPGMAMVMAGSDDPTAHVRVKGIGLGEDKVGPLCEAVCSLLSDSLGVPGKRVFITFDSYKGSMWGVDGRTF